MRRKVRGAWSFHATNDSDEKQGDEDDCNDGLDGLLSSSSFREIYCNILPPWIIEKCEECGWTHPTQIQEKVLDAIFLEKQTDLVVQSETGSGKTLAYLLPCLAGIDASRSAVQALIVVPTRELGLQIARVAKRVASAYVSDGDTTNGKIMIMTVLQGSQNRRQRAWAWAEPPHVVIGTPSELCLMITNGGFKRYNSLRYVIVDEVDACLLNHSFQGGIGPSSSSTMQLAGTQLHELLSKYLSPTYDSGKEADKESDLRLVTDSHSSGSTGLSSRPLSTQRITIFCSATIDQHRYFMRQCVQNQWMLHQPIYIGLRPGRLPSQIEHGYIVASSAEKRVSALRMTLKKILQHCQESKVCQKVLVFTSTLRQLEDLAVRLTRDVGGIYWNEQTATSVESGTATAIVSVLRFEDSLSQRALAMDSLRGESRQRYVSATDPYVSLTSVGTMVPDSSIVQQSSVLLRILLSTDLAARGLDVADVSHVIQLDLPDTSDGYVHRAGRTGRMGRSGQVVSIVTPEEEFVLKRLTNKLQIDMSCIAKQQQRTNSENPGRDANEYSE